MEIKVSVIIPVYNAERYLVTCIESLLNQTIRECEFIFVNDGSKDKCMEIIERYQQIDDRIKLINQTNQGVSIARNNGLKAAVGEYIGFVDADDYIKEEMFEVLYTAAKQGNCDVVISNYESEMNDHLVVTRYPFPTDSILRSSYIEEELLTYFLKKEDLNTVCSKLYKHETIRTFKVEFPGHVALGEDGMFNLRVFRHAAAIQYMDYTGYHYREVAGSATRNISEKDYFQRALEVYKQDLTDVIGENLDKVKVEQLKSIKLIHSVMSYIHIYFTPSPEMVFGRRYAIVKKMIGNTHVQQTLPIFYDEMYSSLGRFDKCMVKLMQRRSTLGLYFLTAYSRLRNK
ncbi:Glycosyl transferase family 2 [Paenibacillus sp. 1_12]|uniref:glycosyltransferase n=1 Tax=Paenibacillus sp. 1_12 TaxID=1566278 RepID=UPI0008ED28C1|nr:glycosyltransferase [Paenibacillus sp. 1_12]SFL15979.1 Glycosyl transferase family 2 [Paenibacillus sp. 1_12]